MRLTSKSVVFVLALAFSNCQNHEEKRLETHSDIILDAFPDIPYRVERPVVVLPDSLGGENQIGNMNVSIRIDSLGKIIDYKIIALKLKDDSGEITINYSPVDKEKEEKTLRFNDWIEEYLGRIVFTKRSDFNPRFRSDIYEFMLPIQFGENLNRPVAQ